MTARLVAKLDVTGDGRLSFEEFDEWFQDARAGLVRLLRIASASTTTATTTTTTTTAATATTPDGDMNEDDTYDVGCQQQQQQQQHQQHFAPSFVCRNNPEWPTDEYLVAAVQHLGKRLSSLADFPQVRLVSVGRSIGPSITTTPPSLLLAIAIAPSQRSSQPVTSCCC